MPLSRDRLKTDCLMGVKWHIGIEIPVFFSL